MKSAAPRARVTAEIFDRYPEYRARIAYVTRLVNGPSNDLSRRLLREAEDAARRRFDGQPVAAHPHIASWRRTYASFGSKPSRFRCSAEALLQRTLKSGIPPINHVVDLYNSVSLKHVVPIGGEDLDHVSGGAVLCFAAGGEPFEMRDGSDVVTVPADRGEVIWLDDEGVTCRRWNWRQCARTVLTEQTTTAYFVLDALDPCPDAHLDDATEELLEGLRRLSPGCEIHVADLPASPL